MTTFHPFLRLPYELRARIWKLTVEPRLVDISVTKEHWEFGWSLPFCTTPVPAPLHASQESRRELQRHYQRAFSELHTKSGFGDEGRYVWTNLDLDIISIGDVWHHHIYEAIAPMVQRLRFEVEYEEFIFEEISVLLKFFINLKEIFFACVEDDLWIWAHEINTRNWPCGIENVWIVEPRGKMMIRAVELAEMSPDKSMQLVGALGTDPNVGLPFGNSHTGIQRYRAWLDKD